MPALLLDVAIRAVLIAAGAAFILWALRIRPAAGQHAAWTTVLVVMLLLPIWSVAGPHLALPVLPVSVATSISQPSRNPDLAVPLAGATLPLPGTLDPSSGRGAVLPLRSILIGLYLVGAIALLTRLAIGTLQALKLCRAAVIRDGRATSVRCATPITVGWFAPVLILPEGWQRWPAAQLDAVLTHEGAHARRRDPLVQWLALLNRAIFWFHPLAWWLERRLANLAEEACDAAVLRAGHSPQDYCDYLIDMARTLTRQGKRLNVIGMAMPGSGLPVRMKHIFEEGPMKPLSRARAISTVVFCSLSSIVLAGATLAPRAAGALDSSVAPTSTSTPEVATPGTPAAATQDAGTKKTPPTLIPPKKVVAVKPPPVVMAKEVTPPTLIRVVPKVDLSGEWVQVDSIYNGTGRGNAGGQSSASGERRMISIASGAALNCGVTCTIAQNGDSLTVIRPDQPGTIAPDSGTVTLATNGSESSVKGGSASENGEFKATAKWEGEKLVVTRAITPSLTVTQTLSLVGGKLHVVTQFSSQDAPVTMIYEKR